MEIWVILKEMGGFLIFWKQRDLLGGSGQHAPLALMAAWRNRLGKLFGELNPSVGVHMSPAQGARVRNCLLGPLGLALLVGGGVIQIKVKLPRL